MDIRTIMDTSIGLKSTLVLGILRALSPLSLLFLSQCGGQIFSLFLLHV